MGAAVAYTVLADILGRHDPAVLRRGPASSGLVGLSFDDGPHPELTPRVLDALAAAGGHATFFVVGQNVRRHPEIVRRIVAEGHALGVHTDSHRHAWTLSPAATRQQIAGGLQAITDVAGVRPRWFRPPWGAFNLTTRRLAAGLGLRIALWSCDAGDWLPGASPGAILRRVQRGIAPGAVIDLHDGGQVLPGCRAMTASLPAMLAAIARAGLRSGHLGELLGETAHN